MRVLVDIVHPADVLFFKRPLDILKSREVEILILSRRKDVVCALLDEFEFAHEPVSTAGRGTIGLAAELVRRDLAVIRAARRFRPDVMIGFGGVAISHAGRLLGIPSISFYDTEIATLQTRITWPFIDHLYVPDAYKGPTPAGRTTRLPGTKELSYLHPTAFTADREAAIQNGLDPAVDNFFLRVVGWQANHDIGKSGWSGKTLRSVVAHLSRRGRVHVSSEVPLPEDVASLRYSGSVTEVHHLMANCRLIVGESATMASEAAILGVPAIYCGRDFRGYVQELEAAGLVYNLPADRIVELLDLIDRALTTPPAATRAARDRYVTVRPDWALAVIEAIDRSIAGKKSAATMNV